MASESLTPKKGKQGRATPQRIEQRMRERQALELRKAGATYEDISRQVGYHDASGARKAVIRSMNRLTTEPTTELRAIQYERYNSMLVTLWPEVQQGEQGAINTALRVMGEINGMMGVLAPTEKDININHTGAVLVVDGTPEDYIASLRQARGEVIEIVDGIEISKMSDLPVPAIELPSSKG